MHEHELVCLMVTNCRLSPAANMFLLRAACAMVRKEHRQQAFKHEDMEGKLYTKFEQGGLGFYGGLHFWAEVETELGRGKVSFIVSNLDLDDAETYRDEDLHWSEYSPRVRERASTAHYN